MNPIEPVILYDKTTKIYNFPFNLQFKNYLKTIDFYFYEDDYKNQEEMLKARIVHCSNVIFNQYMNCFEYLQEICLDDSIEASNDSVNRINSLLANLYCFHNIFNKIHCSSSITSRLSENIDELLEMFLLLEDYYTIERKSDLHAWKNKIFRLKGN